MALVAAIFRACIPDLSARSTVSGPASLARAGSQLGSLKFPAWDSLSAQTLNPAVPGKGVWTEQSCR